MATRGRKNRNKTYIGITGKGSSVRIMFDRSRMGWRAVLEDGTETGFSRDYSYLVAGAEISGVVEAIQAGTVS